MLLTNLFRIQPLFQQCLQWQMQETPPWANQVIYLREDFYTTDPVQYTHADMEAAFQAAELFGQKFRLPVATGLLGLLPRVSNDARLQRAFASNFSGSSFSH